MNADKKYSFFNNFTIFGWEILIIELKFTLPLFDIIKILYEEQ